LVIFSVIWRGGTLSGNSFFVFEKSVQSIPERLNQLGRNVELEGFLDLRLIIVSHALPSNDESLIDEGLGTVEANLPHLDMITIACKKYEKGIPEKWEPEKNS